MARKGANKEKCKQYRAAGVRERNKKRKLSKHVHHHPNDEAAARHLTGKER